MEKIKKARPKFKTLFLAKAAPEDTRLERLKYWCRRFHCRGLTPSYGSGSYGNLSFRVKKGLNGFIITTSGLLLKNNLKDGSFFHVTGVGPAEKQVSGYGLKPPSSESLLHFAIYRKRRDVNAIFHGHCAELLDNAHAAGIPQTFKEEPYGTKALVNSVLKILGKNDLIIMKGHGFISLGKDMDDAGDRALKARKTA